MRESIQNTILKLIILNNGYQDLDTKSGFKIVLKSSYGLSVLASLGILGFIFFTP